MIQTIFVEPIYNALIFILGIVPGGDFGLAIIILTIVVRAIFYPAFTSSIRTQMAMQAVQPELAEIQEKYKDDRMEMARRQSELFKRHRINIPSMFGTLLIQIVIFISLSYAFFGLGLPEIRTDLLYPFVNVPAAVNELFLGFLNLTTPHHVLLAALVAALQYATMRLSLSRTASAMDHLPPEKQMAQRMQRKMMLYFFPAAMAGAAYFTAGAVGLYLAVSTLISLGQEWLIRRKPL